VADALTKLAAAEVIQVLVNAMKGCLPTRAVARRTSVTPGPANRGDIAGDGPTPCPAGAAAPAHRESAQGRRPDGGHGCTSGPSVPPIAAELPEDILHPGLPADRPMWKNLLEAMYRRWSALHNVPRIPEIMKKYEGAWHTIYAAFVRHHQLTDRDLQRVFDDVFSHDLDCKLLLPPSIASAVRAA